MSGVLNKDGITIRRGDSFTIKLKIADEQGKFDLSGAEIKMAVADENGTQILYKNGIISDAVNGLAAIELSSSDTDIEVGQYFTDIQLKLADGQVHTIYPQNVNTLAYFRITAQVTE